MVKRSFSGISRGYSRAVKRRKGMGGFASQIGRVRPVATLAAKVNKLLSEQERKNHDSSTSLTLVANAGQILQLNSIAQGDDATSRDGRKISMVSSHARYVMGSGIRFRVIVFMDKQSNGVVPAVADVLTAPTNYLSPLTLDFKERFRVIHDNFCSAGKGDYDGTGVAASDWFPCEYFYAFKDSDAQVEYGGIGNVPTTNALLMLVIAPFANTLNLYHRLRYTDS